MRSALTAAAAAAPVYALSEIATDRIWLLASTLPMMNEHLTEQPEQLTGAPTQLPERPEQLPEQLG